MSASRRTFLQTSALAATGAALAPAAGVATKAAPPGDRIRMGFIGVGNRGSYLFDKFVGQPDVDLVAISDVYEPYATRKLSEVHPRWVASGRTPRHGAPLPSGVGVHNDFRDLLARKDIDAVCIATPDHWHAIQTIQALEAGKDVYVEKPLTITLHEGRRMVEAQTRTGRVVQVGLNRRGSPVYQKLVPLVRGGLIGDVTLARAYRISNMSPDGIGKLGPEDPPPGFDWDLWLGPRASRPYQYNIAPYYFRWWKDYSSQMGNWGVHYMDAIRWMLDERAPVAISAHGTTSALTDDRTIPDTMEVTFELASGPLVVFGIYEASGGPALPHGEIELQGTKGTLYVDEGGYRVVPSRPGQFQTWERLIEPTEHEQEEKAASADVGERDSTVHLIRNFLDCVKTRATPLCPLEEGHRSTSFAHLGNIALETKSRIEWDPEKERVTNLPAANDLLHYEYRQPWSAG
jgi:predicted dehydrogenase